MVLKNLIRSVLIFLRLDLTQNLKYDRLTFAILKQLVKSDSNCVDVGCHKGEILQTLLQLAPQGKHTAFEPIPYLFQNLQQRFGQHVDVYPYALSNRRGKTQFHLVKNAPAYSGIKQRRYDRTDPEIELIEVEQHRMDEVISSELPIHLIKIDVEGGEFDVLKGAINLLKQNKPTVIFECGTGASDFYGTQPEAVFQFLSSEIGLNIYTLEGFLKKELPLSQTDFTHFFQTGKEYYFIAHANIPHK